VSGPNPADSGPGVDADAGARALNGRYRLVYKLGGGGMGSVWLAEDMLLERSVALKELMHHAGASDQAGPRLRAIQEARAMARVRHPAIVPIHDVFFVGDDPWIVMEYISGRSLQDIIKDQLLDELSIARIGLHVLRGLIAVHRAGVVHRDVKPTNILVADDGSIFLVDFGIARIAGDSSLTGQSIVGTPDFLAPERLRTGFQVGPPADIWALGVTFYYAMEGSTPFSRDSERSWEATMVAILHDAPRPPSQGGRLANLTLRMLDKDPRRRADAQQVLAVLERVTGDVPSKPSAPPHPVVTVPPNRPALLDASSRVEATNPLAAPEQERRGHGWRRDRPASAPQPRRATPPARRGPRVDDARAMIKDVGTDTGVALLLAMSADDAARILTDCPPRLCGAMLQGIAAARPATAAAVMGQLRATVGGRALAYLRPETAASLVAVMTPTDAVRVLDNTDERTVAALVMELAVPTSAALLRSMYSRQRAAQVLTHVRPSTAGEILSTDADFATTVLRYLSEPVRKQVSRYLQPGHERAARGQWQPDNAEERG
jgi:eukaryotic-like serine/threonine-protein kinase